MSNEILDDYNEDRRPAEYAGFWLRVAALLIDGLILSVVFVPLYYFFILGPMMEQLGDGTAMPAEPPIDVASILIFYVLLLVIYIGYFAGFESSAKQATWGKQAVGIKVTDLQGNRISFGRAIGRYFGKILSALIIYIGFIMAGFTEKKQALHDMIASTLVVRK